LKSGLEHVFGFGSKYEESSLHVSAFHHRTTSTVLLSLGAFCAVLVSFWAVAGLRRGARAGIARNAESLHLRSEDSEIEGLVLGEA